MEAEAKEWLDWLWQRAVDIAVLKEIDAESALDQAFEELYLQIDEDSEVAKFNLIYDQHFNDLKASVQSEVHYITQKNGEFLEEFYNNRRIE